MALTLWRGVEYIYIYIYLMDKNVQTKMFYISFFVLEKEVIGTVLRVARAWG